MAPPTPRIPELPFGQPSIDVPPGPAGSVGPGATAGASAPALRAASWSLAGIAATAGAMEVATAATTTSDHLSAVGPETGSPWQRPDVRRAATATTAGATGPTAVRPGVPAVAIDVAAPPWPPTST